MEREIFMMGAVCGVHLKVKQSIRYVLGHWYGHALKRADGHVCRGTLNFDVYGQSKR